MIQFNRFLISTCVAVLASNGLSFAANTSESKEIGRHDFFYAGESKQPRMYIVKNGGIEWQHLASDRKGEISDAILLTDGNVLIAHQYGIAEIAPDHSTVWSYDAPDGCEIHTIQPIGEDKVLFVQNGMPAKVIVMEIPTLKILKEFPLLHCNGERMPTIM
ncbi:MAG: hypothetical protein K2N35_12250 [Muribaculaceae bacterium]|nr:hypothetical protein [Muribaculaceae bacterium]